jgi:hypothetical protein
MMISLTNLVLQTGVAGDLGPPLASYLDALDRGCRRARRRAWRRLVRAHRDHRHAVALLQQTGTRDVGALARTARTVRTGFAALAEAERRSGSPVRRRPADDARKPARRYAVATMERDAALRVTLAPPDAMPDRP